MVKKVLLGVLAIVLAVGGYFVYKIGPNNIIGMLLYDQRREGNLVVGDTAPAIELVSIDGQPGPAVTAIAEDRPLVLIFGSFT